MQLQIKADTRQLENALYLLAREARVAPGVVIKEETGLLVRNIMQLTPPKNLAQGRKAIQGDLFGGKRSGGARYSSIGIIQRIGNSTLVPPRNNSTETVGVNLGWEQSKKIRIYKKFWKPNASQGEIRAWHKRFQNPKTGRTGQVSQSRIGRWKVQDQLWVNNSSANKYLRTLQSRVGWAKAGFVAALNAAGKTAPGWIQRHAAKAGAAVARFGENPMVSAVAHNIKIPNFQRLVDGAVKNRERITERKIDRLVAGKAVNLGFTRVEARN